MRLPMHYCTDVGQSGTPLDPPRPPTSLASCGWPPVTPSRWADPCRACGCMSATPAGDSNRSGFPGRSPSAGAVWRRGFSTTPARKPRRGGGVPHPRGVGVTAVVAREAPNGEQQLVAYIVGESASPSDAEAREWLRRRLPEHMVPSAFMYLRALPLTPSS